MLLSEQISKGIFLPQQPVYSNLFNKTDSKSELKKNLKSMPSDWYYHTNQVTYTTNKWGYRCPEFETIDWANCGVIFGGSDTFGSGVTDEDTLSHQLSLLFGFPIINLSVGGTGIQHSFFNSVILKDNYPEPKLVIYIWTDPSRYSHFSMTGDSTNFGPWNFDDVTINYALDGNDDIHALLYERASRQLWKSAKYYSATFFHHTSNLLKCDLLQKIDDSRDLTHPGPKTFNTCAKFIYHKYMNER